MCHNPATLLESVAVSASCIRICGCHEEHRMLKGVNCLPTEREQDAGIRLK